MLDYNRERVPFVLPEDFIFAISNGSDNPRKSKQFEKFQETCGKGMTIKFLVLLFYTLLFTSLYGAQKPRKSFNHTFHNDAAYRNNRLGHFDEDSFSLLLFRTSKH